MYSGTTFSNASGNVIGAHQKIDRVARRLLKELLPSATFPPIKQILHFEGKNGPDGVKRKSPAQDEPWHYYDPTRTEYQPILEHIEGHYHNLVSELRQGNEERAAFEAAWLAHALVDGLTPAHHFPFEEELEKLRGAGLETRNSVKEKIMITGDSAFDTFQKNWRVWGAKGLMTAHYQFEWGVATIIKPMRLHRGRPTSEEIAKAQQEGLVSVFCYAAREIAKLDMYRRFARLGWTRKLHRQVRRDLAPQIVKVVVLAWYLAATEAGETTNLQEV